ncbi:hypothetical protein MKK88_30155 [Methylobacterium sp. E-005]|uniref:hypothetical protein n=1 Tax=Methylobacterium sp. E-005 TaxID=2836549 RepID=UPI001FBA4AF6|nr:hypothetical protein [Methylobacterium sp. E-005]MCJ2090217.1 hypothetical protein [Methylobacterium sp. E-005]
MTNELELYYGQARSGNLACIQRNDPIYGDHFIFTRVLETHPGQIRTRYGTFWSINGERIDDRWQGRLNQLVLPTITRLESEERNLQYMRQTRADRKFELAAARAVLERRMAKMPEVPPPPIPTLEEAEIELRDATTYWMSIDQILDSPGNSIRLRREASERLATARTAFQLASRAHGLHRNHALHSEGMGNKNYNEYKDDGSTKTGPYGRREYRVSTNKTISFYTNNAESTSYTVILHDIKSERKY